MLLLLAASLSRCASSDLCPTGADLIAAVEDRGRTENAAMAASLAEDGAHLYGPPPIGGIRNIRCGAASQPEPRSVNCTYELRYGRARVREIARLTRDGESWRIIEALSVELPR